LKVLKWFQTYSTVLLKGTALAIGVTILTRLLTGKILFATIEVGKGWAANLFSGFFGAAVGASAAILFALAQAWKVERRRRTGLASVFRIEVLANKVAAGVWLRGTSITFPIQREILKTFTEQIDLFDETTANLLTAYRWELQYVAVLIANDPQRALKTDAIDGSAVTYFESLCDDLSTALVIAGDLKHPRALADIQAEILKKDKTKKQIAELQRRIKSAV
jgi:hypothetical protein